MPGTHSCAVPKTFNEAFAIAAPYIERGLAKGERCVFLADDNAPDVVRMALRARGIDVPTHEAAGRLSVVASKDTPLGAATLDAKALYGAWATMTDQAVSAGFAGLRVVVEMTWALDHDSETLSRYERNAGPLFAARPLEALCLYNGAAFPEETLVSAAAGPHHTVLP